MYFFTITIIYQIIFHHFIPYFLISCFIKKYCMILHLFYHIVFYCVSLYYTSLHYVRFLILCVKLHYMTLYYIILILYHIVHITLHVNTYIHSLLNWFISWKRIVINHIKLYFEYIKSFIKSIMPHYILMCCIMLYCTLSFYLIY